MQQVARYGLGNFALFVQHVARDVGSITFWILVACILMHEIPFRSFWWMDKNAPKNDRSFKHVVWLVPFFSCNKLHATVWVISPCSCSMLYATWRYFNRAIRYVTWAKFVKKRPHFDFVIQRAVRISGVLRDYSTVTAFAKLRGWSTSVPLIRAMW